MKKCYFFLSLCVGTLFALLPKVARAHLVNTDVGEFYAGMLHPLTSAEHVLPILVLALLASQCGRRAARFTVVLFPLLLMAGVLMGRNIGQSELVHLLSLMLLPVLGILLVYGWKLGLSALLFAAGSVALVLGYRSGVDMAAAGMALQFVAGVGMTGFLVMSIGSAWIPPARNSLYRHLVCGFGILALLGGLYLIVLSVVADTVSGSRVVGLPSMEELTGLVNAEHLSPAVIIGALFGALGWGAAHAFTPGHGKAIVAAYLVGARSTAGHAAYLALTVTITHTLVVFLLGFITLFAQELVTPEQLYPVMATLSGLLVCALGLSMSISRLRALRVNNSAQGHDHDHHHNLHDHVHTHPHGHHHAHNHDPFHQHDDNHKHHHEHHHAHDHNHGHGHSHLPPGADGTAVTWRSLLGLGISGGLMPCPAALVLLLAAISLHRTGFGLILVVAFSLGLAGVLLGVGLLFVKGGRMIDRIPLGTKAIRIFPALSSMAIAVLGAILTVGGIRELIS